MTTDAILDRLRTHRTLAGAPEEELAWLATHARLARLDEGARLERDAPEIIAGLMVVLSGRLTMYQVRGGERRRAFEWEAGDVSGLLPYSRMTASPGAVVAVEDTELLVLDRDEYPGLITRCHEITSTLVHVMVDRARGFTSTDLHDEKMASLGRMAAGLAHELNNPAAAVASGARTLVTRLAEAERAARTLAESRLTSDQLNAVDQICTEDLGTSSVVRSPIEQADHEDEVTDWLEDHSVDPAAAEALANSDVPLATLEELTRIIQGPALGTAIRWIAAVCSARGLGTEIEEAASRIHNLVRAVQGFTDMDREMVLQPVDIGQGLATSVRVLKYRAREKGVGVTLEVADDLPRVRCFGGEINQVWVNLINNAIDAAGDGGNVAIYGELEGTSVVVRVTDDGAGIPPDAREHIFEPFFTTKKEGEGMGLGLDIVRRLVVRSEGEIEVSSEPGRTEFRVTFAAVAPPSEA